MDRFGRFWSFDVRSLNPGTVYRLQLRNADGALCDVWPLATMPDPQANVRSVRLLVYTCAGGHEDARAPSGVRVFRSIALRRRLLARALSFAPDAAIAIGDHLYWDQRSWLEFPNAEVQRVTREFYDRYGYFDRNLALKGTANEDLLIRIADPQIADLYGVDFRSVPTSFVCDDHDYFENDEARPEMVTLPPDAFLVNAQRAIGDLYYPPMMDDPTLPPGLPGLDRIRGVSPAFGVVRIGGLLEAQLFDCARFLDYQSGAESGLIPAAAEAWIIDRARRSEVNQLMQFPSTPYGWSAGKWREWYPDVAAPSGSARRLQKDAPKYLWPAGWWAQHQRLLMALSAQTNRAAIAISGDLHAVGSARIRRSGDLRFPDNPIHSILAGPISTDRAFWPSASRGVPPLQPTDLEIEQAQPPHEKNGFTILDVTAEAVRVRQFAWREPMAESALDALEPFADFEIARGV